MSKMNYAGIDVSAETLMVSVWRDGECSPPKSFPNDTAGHKAICRHIKRGGCPVRVCLESTGAYGLDLALALDKHPGIEVMVANPRAVRRFAEAYGERAKNDIVDTYVLVEFARRMEFLPWTPPSKKAMRLRAICRQISVFTGDRTRAKNRLHAAKVSRTTPALVVNSFNETIEFCERQLNKLTRAARKIIKDDPELKHKFDLLISVKGIGEKSAIRILGELTVLSDDLDARQWVALAGLDPREFKSGKSVNKKKGISKAGNKYLRHALYMPALVACKHEPNVRAFRDHLLAKGKKPIQAVVAVMRKLLHAIWGMFKNDQTFMGEKFYRIPDKAIPENHENSPAAA